MTRPYDPDSDAETLWELKRGFELGLGSGTGGDEKQAKYAEKLDDDYREEWLDWVERCVDEDERCVTVAEDDDGTVAGYVFVLPSRFAFIWDAAVLNELYVRPEYRGTGVADDLMAAAVALARDQDLPLDRLVLDVDRENERAKSFYDRHGFDHWGEMVARQL
ncbi:GNAT family N-acetyltransferase [Haloarchaeobius sp. DYHT-AS-18]|uniref:GNAT family N-acetyltransferase n=1 Tax=Haloarchaeobius sp. DYHT-AS-18 TaxID=3446117 RepID=UPI003EBE37A5